jgi:hypothetical protein
MEIVFLPKAKSQLVSIQKSGNSVILKKITQLIQDIQTNPYSGIGKPEPLKHELSDVIIEIKCHIMGYCGDLSEKKWGWKITDFTIKVSQFNH